jgi:hypothetical protein
VVLGVSLPLYSSFAYAPITLFGTDFQPSSTRLIQIWNAPRPRRPNLRFRLVRFRSPLLPQSRLFSSPRLTKMFQFSRCPPHTLCIQVWVTTLIVAGFPHSDSHGSKLACSSPWRFAAGRVLLRHVAPRHPPCALSRLLPTTFPHLQFSKHNTKGIQDSGFGIQHPENQPPSPLAANSAEFTRQERSINNIPHPCQNLCQY